MLELFFELSPVQGYVGLTLAVPVFLTAFIAVGCGLLFVVGAAIGVSMDSRAAYTLTIAPLAALFVWWLQGALGWVRKKFPAGPVVSLTQVAARDLAATDVGAKARHLATLGGRGARVAPGWVLRAKVFERAVRKTAASHDTVLALSIPRRVLRKLHAELSASGEARFLLRSSFGGEDEANQAAPGIYESVTWERATGTDGLAVAMRQVWASYWSERAVAYRALHPESVERPRLAVLAQPLLAHERAGVAASADLVAGGRERHLVDATTWQGSHNLLTDHVTSAPAAPSEESLPDHVVRQISRLAGVAEIALRRPAEVEWGLQDGRVTLYQARALTGAIPPVTVTNSHFLELPRYPLTPLSHAFLWGEGDGAPGATLRTALAPLGLTALPDDALRLVKGRVMLDVSSFKGLALGIDAGPGLGTRPLLSALFGRSGSGPFTSPSAPALALDGLSPDALVSRLDALRETRLLPLMATQMRAMVVASALDAWLEAACGGQDTPTPRVQRADAGDAWYRAERAAELATPRWSEGEGAAAPTESEAMPAEGSPRRGLLVPWVAWARDRQLTEREALNVAINVVNHEARQCALALDRQLSETVSGWQSGDVFFCTLSELSAAASNPATVAGADERAARRLQYAADDAALVPGTCELDAAGEPTSRRTEALVDGALATGSALGRGQVSGATCVVRPGDATPSDAARDTILVVYGGAPTWGQHVLAAKALVLVGAGPLSHLALLARERGIPVLAAATGSIEALGSGEVVVLDLDAACLRSED